MVKFLFALTLVFATPAVTENFGPDTEILVISKSCSSCVEATAIVEELQAAGYDVIIVQRANFRRIKIVPTLIIRTSGKIIKRVVGLLTKAEYEELINKCQ